MAFIFPLRQFYASIFYKSFSTPLHVAIMAKNMEVFNVLLEEESIDVNAKTAKGLPPLWYALYQTNQFDEGSFAKKLLLKGAKADVVRFLSSLVFLFLFLILQNTSSKTFCFDLGLFPKSRNTLTTDNTREF